MFSATSFPLSPYQTESLSSYYCIHRRKLICCTFIALHLASALNRAHNQAYVLEKGQIASLLKDKVVESDPKYAVGLLTEISVHCALIN